MPAYTRPLMTWDRATGFIPVWHICGFFPAGVVQESPPNLFDPKFSRHWNTDWLAPWGGSEKITDIPPRLGKADIEWHAVHLWAGPKLSLELARMDDDLLDAALKKAEADPEGFQWYALAVLESDADQDALLKFCAHDGCFLWFNGRQIFERHAWHRTIIDKETLPVTLRKGRNTLLFKLERDGCVARLVRPDGSALDGVRAVAVAPPTPAKPVSTFSQLRRLALSQKIQMPFTGSTPAELSDWQQKFRQHFLRCLGPMPPKPTDRKPYQIKQEKCDGYTRYTWMVPTDSDGWLHTYVLIPDRGRRNGRTCVIAHGHGARAHEVAGVKGPARPHSNWFGTYTGNYGEQLARRGFVVGVCVQRGFDERRDYRGPYDPCDVAGRWCLAMGYTYPALHMFDIFQLRDFLATLDEVDPNRMSVSGLSGGGTLSYLIAGYDTHRFAAIAVFCGMCRYRDYALGAGCGMQIVPGLYPTGDVGEVLSLNCPRPLLLGQGRLDHIFNVVTFKSIADDVRRAYAAAGCPERLRVEIYEMAHQYNVNLAEQFFLEWL